MEIILNTSYEKLCDTTWKEGGLPPHKSVVFVSMDEIIPFFDEVSRTDRSYVVVSANSDYGCVYQNENKIEDDMKKWLKFVNVEGIGYNSLVIPSRCDVEQCKITDICSIKLYSYTKFTFNDIPDNIVAWYSTNNEIEDYRLTVIPFGVPEWSVNLLKTRDKDKSLYVNMMLNTVERSQLINYYKQYIHNDLICEREVSHERFVDCVARSKMVLGPNGNGLDSYRILESLYCDSIPIIKKGRWMRAYENLPVLALDNLYVDIDEINLIYDDLNSKVNWDLTDTRADLNYWRNQIESARNLL